MELLKKISNNCYKKTEGMQAVRKGYHVKKPGSPSGYQNILTYFEACMIIHISMLVFKIMCKIMNEQNPL